MFESQYNEEMENEARRLEAAKKAAAIAGIINELDLSRHPEGGWFRETYRSVECFSPAVFPGRFSGERSISTAIYFLLGKGDYSLLHRIRSDEMWHFYSGTQLSLHLIGPGGDYRKILLGSNIAAGESFQAVVPAGCWFGAEVSGNGDYALTGCTVAPGFDFADFELGKRDELVRIYPVHADIIRHLTKGKQ